MEKEANVDYCTIEGDIEEDDTQENASIGTEICGICRDFVIDRGVLDCCQHMFCFMCIDNWAAITNRCPFCKIEFQSITCVPLFDSTGSIEGEENSLSKDDDNDEDWYIQGEESTLSFPSYYIQEDAVICLDGDECKIRSGLVTTSDNLNLDTSIACDSCDIWYHAICVEFNPECTYEESWLCPRCKSAEEQDNLGNVLKNNQIKYPEQETTTNLPFSSREVSVSVADDGETAVVVSFVKKESESESEKNLKELETFSNENGQEFGQSPVLSPIGGTVSNASGFEVGSFEMKNEPIENLEMEDDTKPVPPSGDVSLAEAQKMEDEPIIFLPKKDPDNVLEQPKDIVMADINTKKRGESQIQLDSKLPAKRPKSSTNIMSIVSEPVPLTRKSDKSGVRMKKIMRKNEEKEKEKEKEEKEREVEKLQKEIKTFRVSEKDEPFDDKLLTAFRAVIGKPQNTAGEISRAALIAARKSMQRSGGVRDNLTKKIYRDSNGRRRRLWDREKEVEFWKYRCNNSKNTLEMIETLQSVLGLLKKNSENSEDSGTIQGRNGEKKGSILSRVYLADASVFPRKDDIKPLSDLGSSSKDLSQNEEKKGKNNDYCENKVTKPSGTIVKREIKGLSGSTVKGQKKENQSSEIKLDKRKWALEVLARKNESGVSNSKERETDDGLALKGNYPLLAQLPVDMRPLLAPSRHNKVPVSVRQGQLYRITEHYLRRLNLPVTRRTAETELAVADAVNIEKEIFERSNSKVVYVNLCSQALRPTKPKTENTEDNNINNNNTNNIEEELKTEPSNSVEKNVKVAPDVEEILRLAGLCDSPPNSPEKKENDENDNNENREAESVNLETEHVTLNEKGNDNNENRKNNDNSSENREKESVNVEIEHVIVSEKGKGNNENRVTELVNSEIGEVAVCEKGFDSNIENLKNDETNKKDNACETMKNENNDCKTTKNNENKDVTMCESESESCAMEGRVKLTFCKRESKNASKEEGGVKSEISKSSDASSSVSRKVEAYVKEHIRPLCKSGVISAGQYRWAVAKTTEKVMKFHHKDKNANFLIKEGDKVKKLAEQYVESVQKMGDL